MKQYDYIIVGAGLYGSVFAHEAAARGKRCLVLERRDHIGGNCYTKRINDINVHWYGAHIFHTSDEKVWQYINRFCNFNHYVNSPIANYKGELYNMPFNMNTFTKLWPDVITPEQAKARIAEQQAQFADIAEPKNLYEQGMKLAGSDIFLKLVKGYSEKQWGLPADQIPAFVLRRLPFRFTFDNNYFNDPHQGIPIGGYTPIFEKLLEGVEVRLNTDFLADKQKYLDMAERVLYTGPIDAYFDFRLGHLDFRSLRFDHQLKEGVQNYQGNAVFNYTDAETPYTRVIEHKHFEFGTQPDTVVTFEYSQDWKPGVEPYYPINNERNDALAAKYRELAASQPDVFFGGRLGEYKYYDMDKIIAQVLNHPWLND
ncbi:MAG: UDP-galactopyranose mutase [Bacteroidales bacterium]|nr:UDP-galactopyranose mutase [Bacteroidales bacterium]